MKAIILTKGETCFVDEEDFDRYASGRWRLGKRGYVSWDRYVEGKTRHLLLHRLVAGAGPGEHVHHRDGNTLNNIRKNLVIVVHGEHERDHDIASGPRRGGFKGVTWYNRYSNWRSVIVIDGKYHHIGYFENEEDAARAYDREAYRQWSDKAYLNFPSELSREL